MQELRNEGDFALYKNKQPYYGVTRVLNYTIDVPINCTCTAHTGDKGYVEEFRWSIDGITYSSWIELNAINLQDLQLNPNEEFWIELRITSLGQGTVVLGDNFELQYETQVIDKYQGYIPPSISFDESGNVTCVTKIQNLCFQPYNVNSAACLYSELSYMVNNLFGHNVEYYRAVPNKRAQDVTLMEYTLYDVEPAKCIKLLVPDNEFPDSQLSYNPFGIDFEAPFEVHIDKQYWEEVFGEGTGPQKRDIIYFTLNNRIYEVLSSYLFRAFMEQDSYWKVNLIKYTPKTNRYEPTEVRETLDSLSTDTTELFEVEMRETEEDIVKPQQYNPFIGNREYDPSRESINKDIKVLEEKLNNFSTVISEFRYSLMNLANPTQENIAVNYREPVTMSSTSERSYSAWVSPKSPVIFTPVDMVKEITVVDNTITIQLLSNRNYIVDDIIKLSRVGGISLYGRVSDIKSPSEYTLTVSQAVLDVWNQYTSLLTNTTQFKAERIVPINLINGYNSSENKGIKLDIVANRYIVVKLNETEYVFAMGVDLVKDNWYGIYINISSKFKQINVNVWERKWKENIPSSPQTTELFNIYSKTINGVTIPDCTTNIKYNLLASNSLITNIRLYDKTAELEKQDIMLNQNIVQDSSRAIIIDNALPRNTLPFIGQSK